LTPSGACQTDAIFIGSSIIQNQMNLTVYNPESGACSWPISVNADLLKLAHIDSNVIFSVTALKGAQFFMFNDTDMIISADESNMTTGDFSFNLTLKDIINGQHYL
jgi:hypothetical protein